jgi:hypothetical protein
MPAVSTDAIPVLDAIILNVPKERILKLVNIYSPATVTEVNDVVPTVHKLPVEGDSVIVTIYSPLWFSKLFPPLS